MDLSYAEKSLINIFFYEVNLQRNSNNALQTKFNIVLAIFYISPIMILYGSIVTIKWRYKSLTSVRLVRARTLETAGVAGKESGNKRTGSLGTTATII